jgi:hypothetical protein
MDDEPSKHEIIEISADHVLIQQALNHASRDANLRQKRVGFPIMILNYGKAAWIPTDESED